MVRPQNKDCDYQFGCTMAHYPASSRFKINKLDNISMSRANQQWANWSGAEIQIGVHGKKVNREAIRQHRINCAIKIIRNYKCRNMHRESRQFNCLKRKKLSRRNTMLLNIHSSTLAQNESRFANGATKRTCTVFFSSFIRISLSSCCASQLNLLNWRWSWFSF